MSERTFRANGMTAITASPFGTQTLGTCSVSWTRGGTVAVTAILPKVLDAGTAIKVTGSGGVQSLTKVVGLE